MDDYLRRVLSGEEFLLFDGGMGTMLQRNGLAAGELPELLCLEEPEAITDIHRAYVEAGSQVVTTNTFGANRLKLGDAADVQEVFAAAVACARASGVRYVAADIGPTGALLQPLGTMAFDEAYDLFAEQVRAAARAGADLVIIETMADLLEVKAAVLAAKECCDLPVFATCTFGEDGRTFLGTTPSIAARTLDALGVDALGINCSLGPADLEPLVREMLSVTELPVVVQANAGLPSVIDGETVYSIDSESYAAAVRPIIEAGASVIGGCCGTDPDYIRALGKVMAGISVIPSGARGGSAPSARGGSAPSVIPSGARSAESRDPREATYRRRASGRPLRGDPSTAALRASARDDGGAGVTRCAREDTGEFVVTSAQQEVVLRGRDIAVIGERINPTGKKRLKEALRSHDYNYVVGEAIAQAKAGADLLDVNAGLPELDEAAVLPELVTQIQGVCPLPLQIDSSDPAAIEAAVRVYAGKPLINSVNGKRESLEAVLPLAVHYGCAVVGLTLDENGIPPTAEGRFAIAERIVEAAEAAGLPRRDVAIDCLVMSASTNQNEVPEILRAVSLVKERLGVRTVLGASNVSFGLPARPVLNATFLAAAFAAGLDMPIANPLDMRLHEVVDSWRVLNGQDVGATAWVEGYAEWSEGHAGGSRGAVRVDAGVAREASADTESQGARSRSSHGSSSLRELVLSGLKGDVPPAVEKLLGESDPMEIVNGVLIPALDEVGERFEAGTFFLPQLMASAEAAKAGFEVIRAHSAGAADGGSGAEGGKGPIVLATVKGDIHDIGKNIVRMLLDNYGYRVIDLGRDVDPQVVVDAVLANDAPLVGLSALMTTTVRSMEETIALLREQAPGVKVFVGGAVLNPEYAEMVGADFYAKDAAESARIAGEVL